MMLLAEYVKVNLVYHYAEGKAVPYGLYKHIYTNSVFSNEFSTHYIVLAHQVHLNSASQVNDQHEHISGLGQMNF